VQLGGPSWEVKVGRRDSTTASFNGANNDIPPPTSGLANLTSLFAAKGLSQKDMVALSGTYTYKYTQMHVMIKSPIIIINILH
jgi:peroxidase